MWIRGILNKSLCFALGLLLSPTVLAASWTATGPDTGNWHRVVLDESVYAQLGQRHPNAIRVRDAQGRELAHALCSGPVGWRTTAVERPLTLLSRGVQAGLGADRQITLLRSPGVAMDPPWVRTIVDLRDVSGQLSAVRLPDEWASADITLRSSPDLRQWSRPLVVEPAAAALALRRPTPVSWLALDLTPPQTLAPAQITLEVQVENPDSGLHWFAPADPGAAIFSNPRGLAIRGIRPSAETAAMLQSFEVASRLGPGDAWKARGRWTPEGESRALTFSGVGDTEWRVQPTPADAAVRWEYAHDALELRVADSAELPLQISLDATERPRRLCNHPDFFGPATTLELQSGSLASDAPPPSSAQSNLRPWFLLIALPLLLAWLIWINRRPKARDE